MARLKWKWMGHNERRPDNRWNNIINDRHPKHGEEEEGHDCTGEMMLRE